MRTSMGRKAGFSVQGCWPRSMQWFGLPVARKRSKNPGLCPGWISAGACAIPGCDGFALLAGRLAADRGTGSRCLAPLDGEIEFKRIPGGPDIRCGRRLLVADVVGDER